MIATLGTITIALSPVKEENIKTFHIHTVTMKMNMKLIVMNQII
jgi:hypothetical protein